MGNSGSKKKKRLHYLKNNYQNRSSSLPPSSLPPPSVLPPSSFPSSSFSFHLSPSSLFPPPPLPPSSIIPPPHPPSSFPSNTLSSSLSPSHLSPSSSLPPPVKRISKSLSPLIKKGKEIKKLDFYEINRGLAFLSNYLHIKTIFSNDGPELGNEINFLDFESFFKQSQKQKAINYIECIHKISKNRITPFENPSSSNAPSSSHPPLSSSHPPPSSLHRPSSRLPPPSNFTSPSSSSTPPLHSLTSTSTSPPIVSSSSHPPSSFLPSPPLPPPLPPSSPSLLPFLSTSSFLPPPSSSLPPPPSSSSLHSHLPQKNSEFYIKLSPNKNLTELNTAENELERSIADLDDKLRYKINDRNNHSLLNRSANYSPLTSRISKKTVK